MPNLLCLPILQKVSVLKRKVDNSQIQYQWKTNRWGKDHCFEHGTNSGFSKSRTQGKISFIHLGWEYYVPPDSKVGTRFGDYTVAEINDDNIVLSFRYSTKGNMGTLKINYDPKIGRIQKAYEIEASILLNNGKTHKIDFVVEKPAHYRPLVDGPIETFIEKTLSSIITSFPAHYVNIVDRIELIGSKQYASPNAIAHADRNTIRYFDYFGEAPERRTNHHEFSHLLVYKLTGSYKPPEDYIKLALRDRSSVSEYGDTSWIEDFAEAFMFWMEIKEKGRLLNSEDIETANLLKNRFSYFDNDKVINNNPYVKFNRFYRNYLSFAALAASGVSALLICAKVADSAIDRNEIKKEEKNAFVNFCKENF